MQGVHCKIKDKWLDASEFYLDASEFYLHGYHLGVVMTETSRFRFSLRGLVHFCGIWLLGQAARAVSGFRSELWSNFAGDSIPHFHNLPLKDLETHRRPSFPDHKAPALILGGLSQKLVISRGAWWAHMNFES